MHDTFHLHRDSANHAPAHTRGGVRLWVLLLIPAVVAPLLIVGIQKYASARKARNEAAVIESLRTLAKVQELFRNEDLDDDNYLDYATDLAELAREGLIDDTLASGTMRHYTFGLSGSTFDWLATAVRTSDDAGTRNFAITTNGVVRFSKTGVPHAHGCGGGCAQ